MVFVPLIYATAMFLSALLPPIPIASNIPKIYISDVGGVIYIIGYILLEPVAGTLMLPFLLGVAYYARVLPTQFPKDVIVKYAAAGHVSSWIAQFMGHGLAEGRAPALFDNLFQVPHFYYTSLILVIVFSSLICLDGSTFCVWI
jgi:2-hydroxy fatty acid dioxygenase